jgi:hypothetical protein
MAREAAFRLARDHIVQEGVHPGLDDVRIGVEVVGCGEVGSRV